MKKKAFLFSAGNYEKTARFTNIDLPGVQYDIAAMKKRLEQIKFDLVINEDAKKQEILDSIQSEVNSLPSDAITIVYFTGHGGHFEGVNYIYPTDFATLYDTNLNVSEAGIDISDIISIFKNKGRLILIIDSCRDSLKKGVHNYYSEMTISENVYIAYGTIFEKTSTGMNAGMSWFTEAICDEILSPNIDVGTLFTNVRNNLYRKHFMQQTSVSVDGLLEKVYLHKEDSIDDLDQQVYEFVEKYGDEYCGKYGYFHGDDLIFIDAAQYFGISFLDACWKHRKVSNKIFKDNGIDVPDLPEDKQKIVTFAGLDRGDKFFTFDRNHTWYYNGRQIRMGEIPSLPPSMQRKLPEEGKEIDVEITSEKIGDEIVISINLPNGCLISVKDDAHKYSRSFEVKDGKMILQDCENVSKIFIESPVFFSDVENGERLGEANRNLCGKYVEHDVRFGIMIVYRAQF